MGVEEVRQTESWADIWTELEAEAKAWLQAVVRARVEQAQAREQEAWARAHEARRRVREAQGRAQKLVTWQQAQADAQADVEADAAWMQADAGAEAQEQEHAQVRWRAQERVHMEALVLAGAWGWARAEARERGGSVPSAVANSSTIRDVLSDLHRNGVAHHLWHNSPEGRDEYS